MKLTQLPPNPQSIRGLNTPPAPQGPENQPPQGEKPPGDGFEKQDPQMPKISMGQLALYGAGAVASSAATGAFWAHANQGSAKLELMVNALPVAGAAILGGLGVGAFAGMVAAKGGGSGSKAFMKWGGGTALGITALGVGAPLATQWMVNQLPWSHAVNGAAVGAGMAIVGGAVALGAYVVLRNKAQKFIEEEKAKTNVAPPQDQQPPAPPQDPKPPQA